MFGTDSSKKQQSRLLHNVQHTVLEFYSLEILCECLFYKELWLRNKHPCPVPDMGVRFPDS